MQPDIARLHLENEEPPVDYRTAVGTSKPPQYSRYTRSRDITKEFTDASAGLRLGQLIKDDFFTLFESVGALEIMDPKMDSGFMMPEKDAIVDNFDPLKPMLPEKIIGIMDQMLCYEMAWHDGYPLSQTLFTSLHLTSITPQEYKPLEQVVFHPRQTRDANPLISDILRAYCLGLLKSCDSVIADIISEHYYEEEDFVTQTFTQYLLTDIPDSMIVAAIDSALVTLESLDVPSDIKEALLARLELRSLMLKAFQPLTAAYHVGKTQLWQDVSQALAKVNKTTSMGKPVPEVFSERVQRHLASNTPPRPMIDITWKEAYPKLQRLCEDTIEAYRIATIEQPSPYNIIRFTSDFTTRKPHPSTYARAILQGILFKENKHASNIPHASLLVSSIRELTLTSDPLLSPTNWQIELPSDSRHACASKIDEFLLKAQEEFLNIPRMLSQNKCRMRRTLNQSLAILDSLQAEAEIADAAIHDIATETLRPSPTHNNKKKSASYEFASSLEPLQFFPLAAWAYFHKLLVAEWSVLLGFETEVFLPDEGAGMYAVLAFLAQTREEHLGHVDFFVHRRAQRLARSGDRAEVEEVVKSRAFVKVEIGRAKVVRGLAEGLMGIYSLLLHLHLLPTPPRPYSTPQLRHELRMKPFLAIGTPTLPTHAELISLTTFSPPTTLASIFNAIESSLKSAKTELAILKTVSPEVGKFRGCEAAWADEVKGCLGTCVAAGLAVAGLKGICKGVVTVEGLEGKKKGEVGEMWGVEVPEVEKRWRGGWAVPRLVERK